MAKRKSNSPWGSAYKEGLPSTAVNDSIEVDQLLIPSVNTGNIDVQTGQWEGITLSDKNFTIDATHESVANGGAVLSPQATPDYIDMTGFTDIYIGIKPTNGGNVKIDAFNGPATNSFANLSPHDPVRIQIAGRFDIPASLQTAFYDSAQSLTADVWNIYLIQGILAEQKVLQFKITNDSGGVSNITFAYLRVI